MRLILTDGSAMIIDVGQFSIASTMHGVNIDFTSNGEPVLVDASKAMALFDADNNMVTGFQGDPAVEDQGEDASDWV